MVHGATCQPKRTIHTNNRNQALVTGAWLPLVHQLAFATVPAALLVSLNKVCLTGHLLCCRYMWFWYFTMSWALANAILDPYDLAFSDPHGWG